MPSVSRRDSSILMSGSIQARVKARLWGLVHTLPERLQPHSAVVRLKSARIKLPFPARTGPARSIVSFGFESYEPETMKVFESLCLESKSFFDIGANVGIYVAFAKTTQPKMRIWAFEPETKTYEILSTDDRNKSMVRCDRGEHRAWCHRRKVDIVCFR